jgi:hypothetical protein
MTTVLEVRAPKRKSRQALKKPKPKTASAPSPIAMNGSFCAEPGRPYPTYLHFRMADGSELFHRNAAIEAAGHCPHCLMDFLGDNGFFHGVRGSTHLCAFRFDGLSDGRQWNGKDLVTVLLQLGLPRVHPLNLFDFDDEGARA